MIQYKNRTMITKLEEIIATVREGGRRRVVVAYGQDSHSIEAASSAYDMGVADITLVGDKQIIESVCSQEGIDSSKFEIIDESVDVRCVEIALRLINDGKADVLMKGAVPTDRYMKGILSREYGILKPNSLLSHVTVMEIAAYHKLLVFGDVAIIPEPDLTQKISIAKNLIWVANLLGIKRPKVACLAPSEQILPKIQSSVDATLLAKMGERGQLGADVEIDGPLAFDVSIDAECAAIKNLKSNVAGDADCLLFPSVDTGNVFFKACTKFGGSEMAGIVVGTKAPCVLTSRGDSSKTKLYSIALACLAAK